MGDTWYFLNPFTGSIMEHLNHVQKQSLRVFHKAITLPDSMGMPDIMSTCQTVCKIKCHQKSQNRGQIVCQNVYIYIYVRYEPGMCQDGIRECLEKNIGRVEDHASVPALLTIKPSLLVAAIDSSLGITCVCWLHPIGTPD